MLIVDATKEDSIDKALKKYKKKYEKAGVLRQLRRRKAFAKPSVERRTEVLKAVYRQQMILENKF
ncbi:MAG: 30S ribosomal protein S21 [Sphingobacteriales bacterium]|jgi:small subunit ribosomal protein S21|nr:30S ribosomal protein S21 [Sphingobacteriales bacterium]